MRGTPDQRGAAAAKGALDVTIATPAVVEVNRHDPCGCIHDALREGRIFYYVADGPPLDPE